MKNIVIIMLSAQLVFQFVVIANLNKLIDTLEYNISQYKYIVNDIRETIMEE